jgi:hypothetical protein
MRDANEDAVANCVAFEPVTATIRSPCVSITPIQATGARSALAASRHNVSRMLISISTGDHTVQRHSSCTRVRRKGVRT